jgi:maltose O-acetyltransferase
MTEQGIAEDRPIVVEDDVWFGAAVIVLPGVRVGHGSVIGAGSIVTKDVPPFACVAGSPARILKYRDAEKIPPVQ